MGRILAIDYGVKRTGLAVTDPLGMIANPLETIETGKLMDFISRYLKAEPLIAFVVGEPRRLSGETTHATKPVNAFVRQLKKSFPAIPVYRVDERFTSKMASRVIAGSGLTKKRRQEKELVDQVSAVLILQSYLENKEFIKQREEE